MRSTLRGIRLMLAISWRADRIRSIAAAATASGQYVVLPIRALGLKVVIDGATNHDRGHALLGVAVIVGASAANRLLAWASLNVRMRLREHTQLYLDTHLMGLTAGIPGVEHHDRRRGRRGRRRAGPTSPAWPTATRAWQPRPAASKDVVGGDHEPARLQARAYRVH